MTHPLRAAFRSVILIAVLLHPAPARAEVIRVPEDYGTIQAAIDAAVDGNEVVVAAGWYHEAIDFIGKAIRVRSIEGPEVTIITAARLESSVVHFVSGEGPDSILEGFTLREGFGTRNEFGQSFGGGVQILDSSPTIIDCHMIRNEAEAGGGLFAFQSNYTLLNCYFFANAADSGGGINNECSAPVVSGCVFSQNTAFGLGGDEGGGMFNISSAPLVQHCMFEGNRADWGGGMYNYIDSNVVVENCDFLGNNVVAQGGAAFVAESESRFINSRFVANEASEEAGVLRHGGDAQTTFVSCLLLSNVAPEGAILSSSSGTIIMVNSTAHGNSAPQRGSVFTRGLGSTILVSNSILYNGGDEIRNDDGSTIIVSYSDVQGGYEGEGNIDVDPRFIDPEAGDFRLRSDSPCADAGDNDAVPVDIADLDGDDDREEPTPLDLDGSPRFADDPCMDDTGHCDELCELPIVDMGAYEVLETARCCTREPEWMCDGDVDGDGQVDPVDSGLVQAAFCMIESCTDDTLCQYDLDCDGQINPVDSGIVQSLFGTCEPPRAVCP